VIEKRGLSAVVTTLIIILLVLVAVGIIWVVIRNVVEEGSEQIKTSVKCLAVNVKATAVECNYEAGLCNVTYERGPGGEAIDGIRLVYSDGINSVSNDIPGDIGILSTQTSQNFDVTTAVNSTSVEVAVYFNGPSGNPEFCSTTQTFTAISLTGP